MLNHNHLTGRWNPCVWWYMYMARLNSAFLYLIYFSIMFFCLICVQLKTIARKVQYQYVISAEIIIFSPEQRIGRLFWTSARCVTRVVWRTCTSAVFTLCTTNQNKARETSEMDGLIISSRVIGNQKAFSSKWLHTSVLRKRVQANSSWQCLNGPFHQFGIFSWPNF